jgi:hypothetical protein
MSGVEVLVAVAVVYLLFRLARPRRRPPPRRPAVGRRVAGCRSPAPPRVVGPGIGLLREWKMLISQAPEDANYLRWLVRETGLSFPRLDRARRIRNELAHGDTVSDADLAWARETTREATERLSRSSRR